MGSKLTTCLEGLFIRDGDDLIVDVCIERLGYEAGADALDAVRSASALGKHGRVRRLHGNDPHARVLLLQVCARAADRATGTDASNQDVDLSISASPDLGPRRAIVNRRVGRVGELRRDERIGIFVRKLLRLCDCALHAVCARREHELGTIGAHELAALDRHGVGHHNDNAVASRGGDGSKANAGVATRWLDDDRVGIEQTVCLGLVDHGLRDAVLNRAGRLEVLDLADEPGAQTVVVFVIRQLDKRRVADELEDILVYAHGIFLPYS